MSDQLLKIRELELQSKELKHELKLAKAKSIEDDCFYNMQLRKKNEALAKMEREKSEAYRRQVTCRICMQIFFDPVGLRCSNIICKSHSNDLTGKKCLFCLQDHSMSLNEITSNACASSSTPCSSLASTTEILKMNLYLTESEIKIKLDIEKLLDKNKSLILASESNKSEHEVFIFDYFGKISHKIHRRFHFVYN